MINLKKTCKLFLSLDIDEETLPTEEEKKKIFEKYTKFFSDFLNGTYLEDNCFRVKKENK